MKKIALILKGYPRLSETFIAQEIRELEQRGLDITLVSLRHPTDKRIHPVHRQIKAPVIYLPEYLHQEPLRVTKAFLKCLRHYKFGPLVRQFGKDFSRDKTRNRVRRLGQAIVLAAELPGNIEQLYAHFLHTPASVTRYAAMLTGHPWSCSAHAKDIWTSPEWELKEKLESLEWLATCTRANHEYLTGLAPDDDTVHLVYHGLDLRRFASAEQADKPQRDGSDPSQPVKLISVGRAVAKKGYDDLLDALAKLPTDLHWQLTHIGGGALLDELRQRAQQLSIEQHIQWLGALDQKDVLAAYRDSDLFVLASKIVADGDRDGLPNVLMEAQSQGLCCLATTISGIPELIKDGENGRLVPPENPEPLSQALAELISQPQLRAQLGETGRERLHKKFDVQHGIDQLVELFKR